MVEELRSVRLDKNQGSSPDEERLGPRNKYKEQNDLW